MKAMRNRVYLKAAADDKSSLSLGTTSAGIVCCFGGCLTVSAELAKSNAFLQFYDKTPLDPACEEEGGED